VAGSPAFETVCSELACARGMDRWTARGTLQLSLMDAGLDSSSVNASQLAIVVERLLPRQLAQNQGVDVASVCARLRDVIAMLAADEGSTDADLPATRSR